MPSELTLLFVARIVFAAAALLTLAVAFWSLTWPSVKGTVDIAIADRETSWTAESDADVTTIRRKTSDEFYLSYSYTVAGRALAGSRVAPLGTFTWQFGGSGDEPVWSAARDLAKWYREGTVVDVYYCPLRPQWCCLEPGGFLIALLLGFVTAVLFLV